MFFDLGPIGVSFFHDFLRKSVCREYEFIFSRILILQCFGDDIRENLVVGIVPIKWFDDTNTFEYISCLCQKRLHTRLRCCRGVVRIEREENCLSDSFFLENFESFGVSGLCIAHDGKYPIFVPDFFCEFLDELVRDMRKR